LAAGTSSHGEASFALLDDMLRLEIFAQAVAALVAVHTASDEQGRW
jgi:hypothetical protein